MKIVSLFVFFLLSACVTAIPLSSNETCASDNMTLLSTSSGISHGGAYVPDPQGGKFVSSNSNSYNVNCRPIENKVEACKMKAYQASVLKKQQFNSGIDGKRFLVGTGYFLYVIPGLIANNYYEGKRTEIENSAEKAYHDAVTSCEQAENRLPTSK